MNPEEEFFLTPQLATRWQVTRQWIFKLIHDGRLAAYKLPGRQEWRIPLSEVERYEAEIETNV